MFNRLLLDDNQLGLTVGYKLYLGKCNKNAKIIFLKSRAINGTNLVQGAFFGVTGERAGLQYVFIAPKLNGQVYGSAVLK